ncbi:ACT domain-containing protein [Kamptonema cortianum]|nr:ACT domain-containing protein [Kamptonema cortianum]
MTHSAAQALRQARLYTDGVDYRLVRLSTDSLPKALDLLRQAAAPFTALILDKDEITVVVPDTLLHTETAPADHPELSEPYRLITFDLPLEPTLTGFMALISQTLAEAEIPILPLAAFSRDHLLVPSSLAEKALTTLRMLQAHLQDRYT